MSDILEFVGLPSRFRQRWGLGFSKTFISLTISHEKILKSTFIKAVDWKRFLHHWFNDFLLRNGKYEAYAKYSKKVNKRWNTKHRMTV